MFEKPKSLTELSESELTSIVLALNEGFNSSGPNPGYSWEEHFKDVGAKSIPSWFPAWIKNIANEDLLSMESHDGSFSISLLMDHNSQEFRAYSIDRSLESPPIFFGDSAYPFSKLTSDTVWPLVLGHFESDPSYGAYLLDECDLSIINRDLIAEENIVAFLKKAYSDLHDEQINPNDSGAMGGADRVSLNVWIRKNYGETH